MPPIDPDSLQASDDAAVVTPLEPIAHLGRRLRAAQLLFGAAICVGLGVTWIDARVARTDHDAFEELHEQLGAARELAPLAGCAALSEGAERAAYERLIATRLSEHAQAQGLLFDALQSDDGAPFASGIAEAREALRALRALDGVGAHTAEFARGCSRWTAAQTRISADMRHLHAHHRETYAWTLRGVGAALLVALAAQWFGLVAPALRRALERTFAAQERQRSLTERLAASERRMRLLVESTDIVAFEFDPEQRAYTYIAPQVERYGFTVAQWLEPDFWTRVLHPDDRDAIIARSRDEIDPRRDHRLQCRIVTPSGEAWIDANVTVVDSGEGRLLLRGAFVDISAQKSTERELEALRTRAEDANRTKSEFLADMSHEIRTPLTAILGFADLLREGGDAGQSTAKNLQIIDTIRGAGAHLLTVINDVLDLSKIESGRLTFERTAMDLPGSLREAVDLIEHTARGKGYAVRIDLCEPIPTRVATDPTRFRQILMNLLGNAVKFTEAGGVVLRVRHATDDRLVIEVQDTGPGVSAEQVARLFTPFAQADGSVTRKFGGTGLGLTISRRLARLMGGDVQLVATRLGHGSTFRVELPLIVEPDATWTEVLGSAAPPTATGARHHGAELVGRILLVEDGPVNQRLIKAMLERAGARVVLADHGLHALARLDEAHEPFDLIVTDMQMPVMDGYALARRLRERGSSLPIVALTAHAMAEDRQRCLDAGCDDYATKPIDKPSLIALCARLIADRRARPAA